MRNGDDRESTEPTGDGTADTAVGITFEGPSGSGPFPVAEPAARVGDILTAVVGRRFESASHVAVSQEGRLVGVARIEEVLAADPATTMGEIMDADPPVIRTGVDEEIAAWKAVRHGESTLAVVDAEGCLVDLIPPRRMVEVLLEAHDEDLARVAGYQASSSTARHATEEALLLRLGHRLPWLLLGLAGAIAAAGLVGLFEQQLQENVLGACSVATVVALTLPWLLHRRGMDPAYGSGPLATVVQDLLSLVIYLGVASLILG